MSAEIDTTGCDREPIHIPGAIQPHGVLLVCTRAGELAAFAGDVARVLGWEAPSAEALERLAGRPLAALAEAAPAGPALLGNFASPAGPVDITTHASGPYLLFEAEPAEEAPMPAAAALAAAQALTARLEAAHGIEEACDEAARAVRALTGYGRIMVYRFLADGSGAVVAEARDAALGSFLNHRFPASDIPAQARRLYARNLVRVIPDAGYAPAPIVWLDGMEPAEPLDLSDCALRSVSPIHLQYLRNMDVAASASISIMAGGSLWGLIACHDRAPRPLGFVQRELGKHVGQLLGQQLAARQRARAQTEAVRLADARDEFLSMLAGSGAAADALAGNASSLIRVVPSDGAAVCRGEELALAGSTPSAEQIRRLLPAIEERSEDGLFATDSLGGLIRSAAWHQKEASGLLYCRIARDPALAVLWFRAEEVETVNWAGNPHKPAEGEPGALSPRKSFELWKETVRGRARRWSPAEVEAAGRLRSGLADLLQQQELRDLNRQLRRTLTDKEELIAQKDLLMREVNHRVQNSLQLVNAMLHLQEKEAANPEVRAQFERARQRLTAVAMVHRRLWRTDKVGDVRLETFLAELAEELVKIWGADWAPLLRVEAAPVTLPTDTGIVLGLIVTELLTNAVKYAYGGAPGPLLVEAREEGPGELRVTVADRGIGLGGAATRQSFGSRLVDTLVRQLGGRMAMEDNSPGTRASLYFRP
jgi:light-regulated signal transduction histidine kinase (bacteriophytochrome)